MSSFPVHARLFHWSLAHTGILGNKRKNNHYFISPAKMETINSERARRRIFNLKELVM